MVGFLLGHPVNLKETHALQVDNWSHFFDVILSIFGVTVPKQICKKNHLTRFVSKVLIFAKATR